MLVQDANHPRAFWKMGRIVDLISGRDVVTRGARVRVQAGRGVRVLNRPIQLLYPLEVNDLEYPRTTESVNVDNEMSKTTVAEQRPKRVAAKRAQHRIRDCIAELDTQ